MSKVNEILEAVKGLTVLELSELVKAFEEEFGVSAAAPVAVAAAPAAGAAAGAAMAQSGIPQRRSVGGRLPRPAIAPSPAAPDQIFLLSGLCRRDRRAAAGARAVVAKPGGPGRRRAERSRAVSPYRQTRFTLFKESVKRL